MSNNATYYRTFLPDGPFENRCRANCHNPEPQRKIDIDPEFLKPSKPGPYDHYFNPPKSPEPAKPKPYYHSQKRRQAFMLIDGELRPIFIVEKIDQSFASVATPWEQNFSVLVKEGKGRFDPVVDETYQVIGHVGEISGSGLIVVTEDRGPYQMGASYYGHHGPIDEFLKREEPMFVSWNAPEGWTKFDTLQPSSHYTVITGVDGEVITGMYSRSSPGAIAVDGPIEYLTLARAFTALGSMLAKGAVRSMVRKLPIDKLRQALAGATKSLADVVRRWRVRRGAIKFQVLAEGPRIPGTSIPQWLRIRVNKREWNVERNATTTKGQQIGPATKHLGERAGRHNPPSKMVDGKPVGGTGGKMVEGSPAGGSGGPTGTKVDPKLPEVRPNGSNVYGQFSQVDFPMSSLAGGLEAAERRLIADPSLAGKLFTVEGWEFAISTKDKVWKVYHAVYDSAIH